MNMKESPQTLTTLDCTSLLEHAVVYLNQLLSDLNDLNDPKLFDGLLEHIDILQVLCSKTDALDDKNNDFIESVLFKFAFACFQLHIPKNLMGKVFRLFDTCCGKESSKKKCLKILVESLSQYMQLAIDHEDFKMPHFITKLKLIYIITKSFNDTSCIDLKLQDDLFQSCLKILQMDFVDNEHSQLVVAILNVILGNVSLKELRIKKIWLCLQDLMSNEEDVKLYTILSALLPSFVSSTIVRDPNFWFVIQEGLLNSDALTRKRSMYMLKLLLDVISKNETFSTDETDPVMFWYCEQSSDLWNIWKTIILILESLDEKQLHVIEPCLNCFEDITNATVIKKTGKDQFLHISWLFVIIRRAMLHEAKPLQKWSVHYSLQLPIANLPLIHSSVGHTFIFEHLFNALQSMSVYSLEEHSEKCSPPAVLELLETFLQACIDSLDYNGQIGFCEKMLNGIIDSGFNDLAMSYLTKAISNLKLSTKLTKRNLDVLKTLMYSKLSFLRIEYQKVIFQNLILFYTENTEITKDVFLSFINILVPATSMKLIPLGGKFWNRLVTFFSQIEFDFLIESAIESIHTLLNTTELYEVRRAMVLTLCAACQPSVKEKIHNVLALVTDVIYKLPTNPYLDEKKSMNVLQFLEHILTFTLNVKSTHLVENLFSLFSLYSKYILEYIYTLYASLGADATVNKDILLKYIALLQVQFNHAKTQAVKLNLGIFPEKITTLISKKLKTCDLELNNLSYEVLSYQLITIKLLKCLLGYDINIISTEHEVVIKHVASYITHLDRIHTNNLCKPKANSVSCNSIVIECWELLHKLCSGNGLQFEAKHKQSLADTLLNDIDIISNENLTSVLSFMPHLIVSIDEEECLVSMINISLRIFKEQLGTDHSFWKICEKCMEIIFHKKFVLNTSSLISDRLSEIWYQLLDLGENKAGIVNLMLQQIIQVWQQCSIESAFEKSLDTYMQMLIQVCIFGPLPNKNQRQQSELIDYLRKVDFYDDIESLQSIGTQHHNVRIAFINFLLNLKPGNVSHSFTHKFMLELVDFDKTLSKPKQSYYSNSEVHRKKIRIWQTVLVLMRQGLSSVESCQVMLSKLCDTFVFNNQPSVRNFIEWAIVLLLFKQLQLVDTLWSYLDAATEKKIISVTSIFSACIQLIKILDDNQFQVFVSSAVYRILPWAQAQHITSRVHAQVVLQSIWEMIKSRNSVDLLTQFGFLHHCFTLKEHNTSAVKHRLDLLNHPFYSKFHPLDHYSLQCIFHGFLTLTDYAPEEYISAEFDYLKIAHDSELTFSDNKLLCAPVKPVYSINSSEIPGKELIDMQKKIMPWRVAPPTEDVILQSEVETKRQSKVSNLVLCAVLVDKIPNLGGLCRTSEIFGVGTLVLASQRYLSDPNFKSLSVTAEKWINIEQVLPIKLPLWLEEKKQNGYHLIGVEQTANSKMIGEYKFPEKTVLLLGNEKTGIPVQLIQHLDDCVEIPQYGIIRSLNVHISGALMVWEYCKQHMV